MRLICPNCGAQYEVPDNVIPTDGRDVQCSNCSNTWFQAHPDQDVALTDELDSPSLEPVASPPEPQQDQPEEAQDSATSPATDHPPVAQNTLDPDIADVLRQEAELERTAREAERSAPLESQPDLGLDEAPADEAARRAEQARNRMARMRGENSTSVAAPITAAAAANASRKELLPDIEEINSTLRASGDRRKPTKATDADLPKTQPKMIQKGRAFRRGFFGIVLLAVLAITTYVFGPKLVQTVPATEPFVQRYTAGVEGVRSWLSTSVGSGLAWLDQLASENLGNDESGS